jgi:hypothetical protein
MLQRFFHDLAHAPQGVESLLVVGPQGEGFAPSVAATAATP